MDAIYWYNVTPRDNVSPLTAPANLIHRDWDQLKGINALSPDELKKLQIGYNMGDHVWIKTPNGQSTSPYAHRHVTGVISPQNVLVDRMPYHVRGLRPVMSLNTLESGSDNNPPELGNPQFKNWPCVISCSWYFFKTGESVITTQKAFYAHFMLESQKDAVPDRIFNL